MLTFYPNSNNGYKKKVLHKRKRGVKAILLFDNDHQNTFFLQNLLRPSMSNFI